MDIEAYRKKIKERAKTIQEAFEGEYNEELKSLLSLSRSEIDLITPDTTDLEVYDSLIAAVEEASASNISQAELKNQVIELGEIAVSIAKRVPKLALLFV